MLISIATGFAAGALHVFGGADHLVGMFPTALRSPKVVLRDGFAWGIGHSAGVLVLSGLAIFLKDLAHLEKMSSFAEFTVGISLLVIGVIAIRTSIGLKIHNHSHEHGKGREHQHVHFHLRGRKRHGRHTHAVTSLGMLHGVAGGTHLLAVIPALALPPIGAIIYMGAYLAGSIAAMGVFVMAISLASLKVGKTGFAFLFGFTGILSVATGFFWIQKTFATVL